MPERLTFHAFTEFGWPNGGSHGLWRHQELVTQRPIGDLSQWVELAQLAERGRFDTLFFADTLGLAGFAPGDLDAEIRAGRTLLYDPAVLIPALAATTEHLGFLLTTSILQEPPFTFARRASTIDHLTGGRLAWNIVTSSNPNSARNLGLEALPPRDERYRWAEEYADVACRLWEGSWEEGALVADAESGVYLDPARVHTIDHVGERHRVQGPHLVDPSPQRTPLLVQAGGSPAGRAFAARHAEVQFMEASRPEAMAERIAAVRGLAAQAGREPGDIKFVTSSSFVVGSTEEEARRKAAELDEKTDLTDVATGVSAILGIDLTGTDLDTPATQLKGENATGTHGLLEALNDHLPEDRVPTLREVLVAQLNHARVVGAPEQIADELERWQAAGVGGVTVGLTLRPQTLIDFVDHVIPVLQRRGLAQRDYAPGTLRHKIMGYGDRLPRRHPASRHRRAATSSVA